MPGGAGALSGADGRVAGGTSLAPGSPRAPSPLSARSHRLTTGVTSYASRLMFSRCRGEMLSDVILPPYPPQPSVMAGSRPVDNPTDPCVAGELTMIRKAGL